MRFQQRRYEFHERRQRFGTSSALRTSLRSLLGRRPAKADGSGVLAKEVVMGPKLALPARTYFCFEAGITEFAAEGGRSWPTRAPWVDDPTSWWVQSPNLIWPDGREWLLVSEIDFDSTLIACSRVGADALLAADGIEAVEISRDTQLWQSAAE